MQGAILAALVLLATPCFGQSTWVGSSTLAKNATVPQPGPPPSFVQVCNGGAFATNPSATCTFGSTTGTGDTLIVYIVNIQVAATIATPTGCSSSWTLAGNDATTNQYIYVGTATSSGTCTVTESSTSSVNTSLDIMGEDWQNTNTATDVSPAFASVAFGSSAGPSNTTTINGDVVLSFYVSGNNVTPFTGNNYTQDIGAVNAGSGNSQLAGHLIQSTAGATNMSWTNGSSANGVAAIISLKP